MGQFIFFSLSLSQSPSIPLPIVAYLGGGNKINNSARILLFVSPFLSIPSFPPPPHFTTLYYKIARNRNKTTRPEWRYQHFETDSFFWRGGGRGGRGRERCQDLEEEEDGTELELGGDEFLFFFSFFPDMKMKNSVLREGGVGVGGGEGEKWHFCIPFHTMKTMKTKHGKPRGGKK